MGKFDTQLNEKLREFITAQHIFFNASAPNEGRINVSPKGQDSLRILSDHRVAYLDLTGGENETAAHVAENGRLTLMFCSFHDKPLIVRLYGKGSIVRKQDPEWDELHAHFTSIPGERQIVVLDIESIMSTCGFAVPLFDYQGERGNLRDWSSQMGEEKLDEYRHKRNEQSIDGLPTFLFEDRPR